MSANFYMSPENAVSNEQATQLFPLLEEKPYVKTEEATDSINNVGYILPDLHHLNEVGISLKQVDETCVRSSTTAENVKNEVIEIDSDSNESGCEVYHHVLTEHNLRISRAEAFKHGKRLPEPQSYNRNLRSSQVHNNSRKKQDEDMFKETSSNLSEVNSHRPQENSDSEIVSKLHPLQCIEEQERSIEAERNSQHDVVFIGGNNDSLQREVAASSRNDPVAKLSPSNTDLSFRNLYSRENILETTAKNVQFRSRNLRFKCESCDKSFSHNCALRDHREYKCLMLPKYGLECQICEKCLSGPANMKAHVLVKHKIKISLSEVRCFKKVPKDSVTRDPSAVANVLSRKRLLSDTAKSDVYSKFPENVDHRTQNIKKSGYNTTHNSNVSLESNSISQGISKIVNSNEISHISKVDNLQTIPINCKPAEIVTMQRFSVNVPVLESCEVSSTKTENLINLVDDSDSNDFVRDPLLPDSTSNSSRVNKRSVFREHDFATPANIRTSKRSRSTMAKATCKNCNKSFARMEVLRAHVEFSCPKLPRKRYKCPECNQLCARAFEMQFHVMDKHKIKITIVQAKAFKKVRLKPTVEVSLKKKKRVQIGNSKCSTKINDLICPGCKKNFSCQNFLLRHKEFHCSVLQKYRLQCTMCVKSFSRDRLMQQHVLIDHNLRITSKEAGNYPRIPESKTIISEKDSTPICATSLVLNGTEHEISHPKLTDSVDRHVREAITVNIDEHSPITDTSAKSDEETIVGQFACDSGNSRLPQKLVNNISDENELQVCNVCSQSFLSVSLLAEHLQKHLFECFD